MRIPCPLCGERGAEEFAYLGDATVRRPPLEAAAEAWTDYVYLRDNPSGLHSELWYHAGGCHAWLVAERDLRTHAITRVETARSVAARRTPEPA